MELVVWIAFIAVDVSIGIVYCVAMTLNRNCCVGHVRSGRGEFRPSDVDRVCIGKGNSRSSSMIMFVAVEVNLDLVVWIVFVSGKGNSGSSSVDHVRSGRGEFRSSDVDRVCVGEG